MWHGHTFGIAESAGSQLQCRDGPGRAEEYGGSDERDMEAGYSGAGASSFKSRSLRTVVRDLATCLAGSATDEQGRSDGPHLTCVTPVAELVDQPWMSRRPTELVPSLGRECALIEQ